MDLRSIFIANGVGIIMLCMLLYVSRARIQRDTPEDRVYTMMVVGVMVGCIMEAFSYAIDGQVFTGSRVLNYIANTYLFCANLLLPFFVLVYVDLGLYGDNSRIWKHYKPHIIIGVIMISANLVNFFIPITYYISDQNVYERRPFSYAYYLVIIFYLVTAYLVTRRYEKENGTRAFVKISLFLAPVLIGVALQFTFYGLSVAWLASALGLAGLFMMQQNELAYIDVLVNTYNRQYLNYVLEAWTARGDHFAGALIDIDDFKSINDKFGHSEGDVALIEVVNVLKQSRCNNEWVFRYAGDEFVVLSKTESSEGLKPYLDNVITNLAERNRADKPYQLAISYGVSSFETGDVDSFIKEIDGKMYEMKQKHHGMRA